MGRIWIQKAIKHPGSLEAFFERTLGIPKKATIPESLLRKIVKAKAGDVITLSYHGRTARVRVTRTLERRAALALTLKKLAKRRKKRR